MISCFRYVNLDLVLYISQNQSFSLKVAGHLTLISYNNKDLFSSLYQTRQDYKLLNIIQILDSQMADCSNLVNKLGITNEKAPEVELICKKNYFVQEGHERFLT